MDLRVHITDAAGEDGLTSSTGDFSRLDHQHGTVEPKLRLTHTGGGVEPEQNPVGAATWGVTRQTGSHPVLGGGRA